MKGTEKQIAWVEDIKRTAYDTCRSNIERMSGEALFESDVKAYKVMIAVLDKMMAINEDKDASWWIDHRGQISSGAINQIANRWAEMIRTGKMTAEQLAEKNGVRI